MLDRYEAALYRFFYYSHGDHQLAEDQCGETFKIMITAVKNMNSDNINNLKSFLFGIARNVMRRNRRKMNVSKDNDSSFADIVDGRPSTFRQVTAREELTLAFNAIERFPDPQRQILLLRFVEDFKLEEIASVFSMPVNTVKSHIHRSRKKLCKLLNIPKSDSSEA